MAIVGGTSKHSSGLSRSANTLSTDQCPLESAVTNEHQHPAALSPSTLGHSNLNLFNTFAGNSLGKSALGPVLPVFLLAHLLISVLHCRVRRNQRPVSTADALHVTTALLPFLCDHFHWHCGLWSVTFFPKQSVHFSFCVTCAFGFTKKGSVCNFYECRKFLIAEKNSSTNTFTYN